MSSCPSEAALLAFGEGRLGAAERAELELHIDGCSACAGLLASAVRHPERPRSVERGDATVVARSRYVLGRPLGRGGFADVFEARDRELDRAVAVKVLRADRVARDGDLRARLAREARALARLSHPNIVEVYDVAAGDAGETLLVMALVRGTTLATWLKTPRRFAEILQVFTEAGRGLAAAHAVGIVHRDFKPQNVMIGEDGPRGEPRVRVLDFGLAIGSDDVPSSEAGVASSESHSQRLTQTGTVMGTPLYMAPEQHSGDPADARSDQYAFAVALFDAAYGTLPFDGHDVRALARAKLAGVIREPPEHTSAPRWLHEVLRRALRPAPEDRFPDMAALLAALERRRVRWVAPVLAAGAIGVIAATVLARSGDERCEPSRSELASTWNDAARARVEAGLVRAQWPNAPAVAIERIDGWASRWTTAWTASCEQAERGELAALELDRRMRCLDRRAVELGAVLDMLAASGEDVESVDGSVGALSRLTAPSSCTDDAALASPLQTPEDPQVARAVDELRAELARARVLVRASRYDEGLAQLAPLEARAEAIGFAPLVADVLLVQGLSGWFAGRDTAIASLERAETIAAAAGYFDVVAEAASMLAYDAAIRVEIERAEHWSESARSALARSGLDAGTEIAVLSRLGQLRIHKGEITEARADFERALALAEAAWGPDDIQVLSSLANLANVTRELGEPERALAMQERGLRIARRELRPGHGDIAQLLSDSAITLARMQQPEAARERFERALEQQIALFGEEHMMVAATLSNLGTNASELGRDEEALAYHRRALAIQQKLYGPEHPATIGSLLNIGELLLYEDRLDDAAVMIERAAAITSATARPEDPMSSHPQQLLGRLRSAQHRGAEAIVALRASLASSAHDPAASARTRFYLAQALWDSGTPAARSEAVAYANEARTMLEDPGDLREISAWLSEHPLGRAVETDRSQR